MRPEFIKVNKRMKNYGGNRRCGNHKINLFCIVEDFSNAVPLLVIDWTIERRKNNNEGD